MNTNNNNSTSNMVPIVNREFHDKYLNAEWKRTVTTPTTEVNNDIKKLCQGKKIERNCEGCN